MEKVLQYRIPVLHPLAVHFPVALLLAAALTAALWLIRGTAFWRRCTLLLFVLGAAGAAFAYLTGEAMKDQSEGVPIVDELVRLHERTGLYTLILSITAAALLATATVWLERRLTIERDPRDPLSLRLVFFLMVLASALLVAWTAHVGGVMVWAVAGG